jgi:formylglycine-generating enzyme required for sulfatase activity
MKRLLILAALTLAARADERAVVEQLHRRIASAPKTEPRPYKEVIPGTGVAIEMVPIPGGEFLMGTPVSEPGRKPDEGPQHRVRLAPFWMQKFEVTWDQYRLFMSAKQAGELDRKDEVVDAISRPTRPYVEMSFGMGIEGYPAISMTQHAANKFAEWLSARTGEFYRLPTEAEWEYACRAGTPAGVDELGNYAWYAGNSDGKYQKVGAKKPNAWGLYDMLGNVMEWTLDQYDTSFYAKPEGAADPWNRATHAYPHAVRGGSWNDDAGQVRCGARVASDASWKQQDPQLPKSIWYHTDAQWLGFRVVRPVKVPSAEEMYRYWNSGVEKE